MSNTQVIVALSGRKGAGKNTIGSFIGKYYSLNLWNPKDNGYDQIARGMQEGYLGADMQDSLLEQLVEKAVFECSFADTLKDFCINVLGLSRENCYGTDEQKNAPTEYVWENAPSFLRWKFGDKAAQAAVAKGLSPDELMEMFFLRRGWMTGGFNPDPEIPNMSYSSGKMSGREIMQIFGTDLIRQTFGNVWAEATIRMINRAAKPLSIITDNRFPNEIETVLKQPRGYVIRLTRSPFGYADAHPSESALDNYDWKREKCFVLDNAELSIGEQNEAVLPILNEIFSRSNS